MNTTNHMIEPIGRTEWNHHLERHITTGDLTLGEVAAKIDEIIELLNTITKDV